MESVTAGLSPSPTSKTRHYVEMRRVPGIIQRKPLVGCESNAMFLAKAVLAGISHTPSKRGALVMGNSDERIRVRIIQFTYVISIFSFISYSTLDIGSGEELTNYCLLCQRS